MVETIPPPNRIPIVDARVHRFDHEANAHPFLDPPNEMYKALVEECSALSRRYLLDDYVVGP
jgi:predicted TIM-barrel fold metal-dependent hydrolase